ncbi:MAG: hypothetical protein M5U09_14630 [Gammaproteobacteria bacterium]|nr:hypothetical protein [Gammaproteobacteria bacterium]
MNRVDPLAAAAVLPFHVVESMGVPCGYERSFKIVGGSILANRYLLGIETKCVGAHALLDACRRLGMPGSQLEQFVEELPRANLVFLGFEAEEHGGAIYKVYLEFWDHVRRLRQRRGDEGSPLLSHRGFKWRHDDPTRHVVTDYHWIPDIACGEILARIEQLYEQLPEAAAAGMVRDIISRADPRNRGGRYIYIEVSETGNSRLSFDLNLYAAGMRVRDIRSPVEEAAARLGAASGSFDRLMALVSDKLFGHVSGGVGRDGREYLTIYYEY